MWWLRVLVSRCGPACGSTPTRGKLLDAVGAHLTRARNTDLAAARRGEKANDRFQVLVEQFGIHSRYAGTIWVDNDAATRAVKEHLWRHRAGLRRAVADRRTPHRDPGQVYVRVR